MEYRKFASAATGGLCLFLAYGCSSGVTLTPNARADLAVIREDPVLSARVPHARLLHMEAKPGTKARQLLGEDRIGSTHVAQRFSWEGEPGDVIDAYRREAEASGWALDRIDCSRMRLEVHATLDKRYPAGLHAQLNVKVSKVPRPEFTVSIGITGALAAPPEAALSLPRHDPQCLQGIDPSAPRRAQPTRKTRTSIELCRLLTVEEIRAFLTPVVGLRRDDVSGHPPVCAYVDELGDWAGWVGDLSTTPRFEFDDRGYPDAGPVAKVHLFTYENTDQLAGAWVDAPGGALSVQVNSSKRVEDLVGLARAVLVAASH